MCGLAAMYSYRAGGRPVDAEELLRMREAMISRGPDGAGLWLEEGGMVGLAHRRLAILDLSEAGAQPMASTDGRLNIVFNGEIYNHRELRAELQARGHVFRSTSDTEVLLHAYREYGEEMVERLRGMFAFALWDGDKRGLFLARDPFGIKPLYYHDDGKILRVASQVKALVAGGGFKTEEEAAGQVGFFLWGCVPEPYTRYKNVKALPAGHQLWADERGAGSPKRYFDLAEELGKNGKRDSRSEEVLQAALQDSVNKHLAADVPVGIFLSAGLDSSALAALAAREKAGFSALTLGFSEYRGTLADEVPLARRIAETFQKPHQAVQISKQDFDEELAGIFSAMDQPSIDGVNTYFVARAAKRAGWKVALSGMGGDELLGGYPSFRQIPALVSRLAPIPCSRPIGRLMRVVAASFLKGRTSPKYASLFEYGGSYGGAYLLRRGLYMPWELPDFLDGELVREGWAKLQPIVRLDEWLSPVASGHAKVAAMEMSMYLRNMLLRDADWAGMAHSLEIRTPFVDVVLFRALAPYLSDPENPPAKHHLARLIGRALPEELAARPKTGFSIPVQEWLGAAGGGRGLRGWSRKVFAVGGMKNV